MTEISDTRELLADIQGLRKLLDTEEAQLVAALSAVRGKLNDLLPISWLPHEILEEIFDMCVSRLYGYQKPKHPLAWTQVCCSWRRLSLNSSRLWQRIDLCDTRFADEFLLRSKEAPLFITSTSPLKLTANKLTLHANRLQSIDVFLFPDDMIHLFSSVGRSLPTLTSLSLKVPPVSSTLSLDLSLPHVRRIALDGVAIKWDSCQNLTHLSLRGLTSDSSPSISQLHDILAASPHLEYIRLENLIPSSSETIPRQPISLMNLKDFIISSKPFTIRNILSCIYLGPLTRLQLYLSLSEDLQTVFPHGLPYISNSSSGSRFDPIRHSLNREALDVSTIRLARHGAQFIRYNSSAWCEDSSKMLLSLSSASSLCNHVCGSLAHLLDLTYVTNLELNTGVLLDIPRTALESLFRDLHNLDTLRMAFNDMEHLFGVLQVIDGTTGLPYLPRLAHLSFSKPSDLWWHFGDRWIESIFQMLRTRRDCSLSIQSLTFFKCQGLLGSTVQELKEIVPRVDVMEQINSLQYASGR